MMRLMILQKMPQGLVKHLSRKHDSIHEKKQRVAEPICNPTVGKCRDRRISGGYWPISLAKATNFRFRERPPSQKLRCFGSLLDNFTNSPKGSCSCLALVVLLGGLWLLEGALSAQIIKFHLNYTSIFTHRIMYYRVLFKR